jgi:hypothetical protein
MANKKPIKIEIGEWWYMGCFIQKQEHPKIKPFHIFKDTEMQESINTCSTFLEAKKICELNEVKKFKQGYKQFIQ